VVLLGFPTAGKTWFLNRLKYELQEGDAYACYPRRAPPGDVENTTLFTAHRFRKGAHDFYVIDIPGERFLRAVEGSFLGESNTLMRHVIYTGQAFLTLMPADETLLSELAHDVLWRRAAAGGSAPSTWPACRRPRL
jgi:GTPase SAR1 family protein